MVWPVIWMWLGPLTVWQGAPGGVQVGGETPARMSLAASSGALTSTGRPLTTQSVVGLLPHAELYADRTGSTAADNVVQGIEPLITELIAMGDNRTEAYIARETIAAATGAPAGHLINTTYPRQLAEAGIVTMTSRGEFGMVRRKDGTMRGIACGWAVDR